MSGTMPIRSYHRTGHVGVTASGTPARGSVLPKLLLSLLMLCTCAPGAAVAQDVVPPSTLDQLIEVIEDDRMRLVLLDQLRNARDDVTGASGAEAIPEGSPDQANLMDVLTDWASDVVTQLPTTTFGVPIDEKLTDAAQQLGGRVQAGLIDGQLIAFTIWALPTLFFVVCGCIAIRLLRRRWFHPAVPVRKRWLATALSLKAIAHLALFCVGAVVAIRLSPTSDGAQVFTVLTVGVIVSMLSTDMVISGLSLLNGRSGVRLIRYCQSRFRLWFLAISILATFAALVRDPSLQQVVGSSTSEVASFSLNLLAACIVLIFTFRHRPAIDRLILRAPSGSWRSDNPLRHATLSVARHWQVLACAFLALSVVSLVGGQRDNDVLSQMLWSFATALCGFTGVAFLNRALEPRTLRRRGTVAVRRTVANAVLRVLRLASNAILAFAVSIILARIWGFNLGQWMVTGGLPITGPIIAAAAVLAIAWLVWVALDAWISSALAPEAHGRSWPRSGRLQTLLPLIRNGIMIVLAVLAAIAVLANIGVDVTPLIAGAGVFGLALSFGSQQLVQDLITGVFILAEDTISIGDTINTGDRSGVVENISLRTIRLRDADGALHSVPFSTIKALKNSSRNYGILRPRYTVPTGIAADIVLDEMRATARYLRADPKFAGALMGDLQDAGVDEINAGSVVVSGSLRTTPSKQVEIGRAFNGRLLEGLRMKDITL